MSASAPVSGTAAGRSSVKTEWMPAPGTSGADALLSVMEYVSSDAPSALQEASAAAAKNAENASTASFVIKRRTSLSGFRRHDRGFGFDKNTIIPPICKPLFGNFNNYGRKDTYSTTELTQNNTTAACKTASIARETVECPSCGSDRRIPRKTAPTTASGTT